MNDISLNKRFIQCAIRQINIQFWSMILAGFPHPDCLSHSISKLKWVVYNEP